MIVNKKFLYALEAILDIAINSKGNPVYSHKITKRQGIPIRYLESILQKLVHHNILKGTRGPKGGYSLAKEKRNIFLIDIYNVILSIEKDKKNLGTDTEIRTKIIMPLMSNVSNKIKSSLSTMSIEDLYKKIKDVGIVSNTKKKADFSI